MRPCFVALSLSFGVSLAQAAPLDPIYQLSQAQNSSGNSSSWLDAREEDEQACIKAVIRATGNADIVVQKWETADGKTALLLGVDEEREPWRCIVRNGQVEEVGRYE